MSAETDTWQMNGAAVPARVTFGQRDNQHVPVDIASAILSMLRERQPVVFGQLLAEAMIGPEAVRRRKANGD